MAHASKAARHPAYGEPAQTGEPIRVVSATDRTGTYSAWGGPVSEMLLEIENRMAASSAPAPLKEYPEDIFHSISVACGYLALVGTFAGSAYFLWWLARLIV